MKLKPYLPRCGRVLVYRQLLRFKIFRLVSFPRSLKIPNKQFTFSVYGSERKALDAAILHRDSIIKEISKKFNP